MRLAPTDWMRAASARALAALGRYQEAMDLAAAAPNGLLLQEFAVGAHLLIADIAARLGNGNNALAWLLEARNMAAGGTPLLESVSNMLATLGLPGSDQM